MSSNRQCNGCVSGCPRNYSLGACCGKTCCKEQTDCNRDINELLDRLAAYRLKLRLLRAAFKKRFTSCCDEGRRMSPAEFAKKKCDLERKICRIIKQIIALKRACKGNFIIRNPDRRCTTLGPVNCGCCKEKKDKCSC